ncbi:MAG: isoaspartyl peptidase/L-asparaginase [Bacteroidales bacterium]|nr:isoaspartyl peptidase/L-asparaginase [Bacteroidales bacterium]
MKRAFNSVYVYLLILILIGCRPGSSSGEDPGGSVPELFRYAMAIHGGAGFMTPENLPDERRMNYEMALDSVLRVGLEILKDGGSSIDAVETVINCLEDNPLFNAGRGAVFTNRGKNELDASIMAGDGLRAGAVAGVTDIKNPISAARAVMEKSEHVLLTGNGASEFAREVGLQMVDPSYFYTPERYQSLHRELQEEEHGTVGCVALDQYGDLCAGTSTGGMSNKRYGRIGDSPIIGAGTYANNQTCAVSSTGHGEFFIRYCAAHDISALMEYQNMSVKEAAGEVVLKKLKEAGGAGGVICLDKFGREAMVFNTTGMFRAYGNSEGVHTVKIYDD